MDSYILTIFYSFLSKIKTSFTFFLLPFLFLLSTLTQQIFAQIPLSQFDNVKIYTKKDGLSSNQAYKIIEDKNGFLWIGTQAGVSRFDGSQFTNFQYYDDNSELKEMGPIIELKIDSLQNRLWASGDMGVFTTSIDEIKFQRPKSVFNFDGFPKDRIEHILIENSHTIWTANFMTGISKIDLSSKTVRNFRFQHKTYDVNRSLNEVRYIIKDTQENLLWIATEGGLILFNSSTFDYEIFFYENNPESPQNIITCLFSNEKYVFVGTENEGLILFNKNAKKFKSTKPQNEPKNFERTLDIYNESNHSLWVTTLHGLLKYNLKTDSIEFKIPHDLSNDILRGISFVDSRGIIWFWSRNGLFRYDLSANKTPFIKLADKKYLEKPVEIKEIIYSNGFFYVLGLRSDGLYKINPKDYSFEVFGSDRLTNLNFRDMEKMDDGNFLIISFTDVLIFNPSTNKFSPSPLQIDHAHPTIQSLSKDHSGRFWIGTNTNGLYCLDFKNTSVTNYKKDFDVFRKENHKWIQKLFVDSKDNLWIAKGSNTVFNLQQDSLQCLNPRDTSIQSYSIVKGFHEDNKGRIWLAGYDQGLGFTNYDNFYSGIQHQVDGFFTGVYPYHDSLIFTLGTDLGKLNLETFEYKKIPLDHDRPELILQGPVVSDGQGKFMIGCNNGVLMFDPFTNFKASKIPSPYIKRIEANGSVFFNGENLDNRHFKFNPETNHLSIQLSTIGFQEPTNTYFEYRNQTKWIKLNGSQQINYSDLNPGHYDLEIRVCNFHETCSPEPIKYTFTILAPWYQSWWTYCIYALFLTSSLYYLYKIHLSRKLDQQEALRLKELDHFKTRFYSNITHEFRTPLTVIEGMAKELEKNPEKEPHKKLTLIKKNSKNLLALINQMLDLSKLQAGKITPDQKQDNIISYIRFLVESNESYAKLQNIGLQFYSEEQKLLMDFDAKKIETIFSNLISNAIKFTPVYGKILVVAKKLKENNQPVLQVKIKDSGIGISPEQLPYIFDRFHQANSTHENQGTGIGLAIVKELIKTLDAKIKVESELDKGTVFTMHFPITNKASLVDKTTNYLSKPQVTSNVDSSQESTLNEKDLPILLIIEDNADITYYLKSSLEDQYQILSRRNGKSGVEKALEILPDIIISDVMMPKMNGFEVCKILKADERSSHIPIILLTAKATSKDKLEGLTQGADAYLTKPFEKSELMIRLSNLMEIRQKLQKKYSSTLISSQHNTNLPKTKEDSFVQKLEKIILDNLDDDEFSIDELARNLFLSRSQVHRKIKALTGMSTAIYIRSIRLQKAKEFLQSSELSISEIAYKVGFKSPVYFSQVFKKAFGKSPNSLRK